MAKSHPKKTSSSVPAAAKQAEETPRRSTRNSSNKVDYWRLIDIGENEPKKSAKAPKTPKAPTTPSPFTPTTAATQTPLSSTPSPSPAPSPRPKAGELIQAENLEKFRQCFPNGYLQVDVSSTGFLCGIRALCRSMELQCDGPHPTWEELLAIARSQEMQEREDHHHMFDVPMETDNPRDKRPVARDLESDYSVDHLAVVLQMWKDTHDRDLALGVLDRVGGCRIYGDAHTTPATKLVWVYTTNEGVHTPDEEDLMNGGLEFLATDHYMALVERTSPASPDVTLPSRKRSATDVAESSAKRPCVDDEDSDFSEDEDLFALEDELCSGDEDSDDEYEGVPEVEDEGNVPDGAVPSGPSPASTARRNQGHWTPYIDAEGVLRIGRQPKNAHVQDIRSIPRDIFEKRLKEKIFGNLKATDKKITGTTDDHIRDARKSLFERLNATMRSVEGSDDFVKRVCDYTGEDLLFTPGPRSASMEAVNPVTRSEGRLTYHENPNNVVLIMSFLNTLKKEHPIIVMPLQSIWLNARSPREQDWALNAANNACILGTLFRLKHTRNGTTGKFREWSDWDDDRLEDMLNALRTGTLTPEQQEQLEEFDLKELFTTSSIDIGRVDRISGLDISDIVSNMRRIATKYGLTPEDFDELCFVDSPSGSRVFYPFWHGSMALARDIGWDWNSLLAFARERLRRLQKNCNKNAEEAGLGESEMDALRLVYWMVHWICRKIKAVKDSCDLPTIPDIASRLLDRWGLPIVPWKKHIWSASVCKVDHGIPMFFGLISRPGVPFDPVDDFNLDECTITIDSFATNMGMADWNSSYWGRMGELLRSIPVQHPLWQLDESLGMATWGSRTRNAASGGPPQSPIPAFTMPLLDIGLFISRSRHDISNEFRCEACPTTFTSIGEWVDHCRHNHGNSPTAPRPSTAGQCPQSQSAKDKNYWDSMKTAFRCDKCEYTSKTKDDLAKHKRRHANERKFPCDQCEMAFNTPGDLADHKIVHSTERKFPCDQCGMAFKRRRDLADHKLVHSDERNFPCDQCEAAFRKATDLQRHKLRHANERNFLCGQCEAAFNTPNELSRHKRVHSTEGGEFSCDKCPKTFKDVDALIRHKKTHLDRNFACDQCPKTYVDRRSLNRHKKKHEDARPKMMHCPECGRPYTTRDSLVRHIRLEHSDKKEDPKGD
ncbi:hypothetical protein CONLIGDRAFT_642564 [Coniochaeta ligniaria NRRL 30616]|uniref:C2H2-type domain-containing protein n=1 Tax=Coniochaeta ligniaria NRRL 30616 TaxID=1408157 RepID=A0A1J7ITF5_9PEZI|nr:hypothetical protein CONLIGDRAFT_642564 [Coniochaeta ligniaria NRRL 30616]